MAYRFVGYTFLYSNQHVEVISKKTVGIDIQNFNQVLFYTSEEVQIVGRLRKQGISVYRVRL